MRRDRFWSRRIIFAYLFENHNLKYMKKVLLFSLALFAYSALSAQDLNPVKWTYEAKKVADGEFDLVFTAHIEDGWYVYSQFLESDEGPIPTSLVFTDNPKVKLVDKAKEAGPKHEGFDDIFEMNVVKYSGQPTFTQRVKVSGHAHLEGYLEFMTCDKNRCLPPSEVAFKFHFD